MLLRVTAEAAAFEDITTTLAHNLERPAVVQRLGEKTTALFMRSMELLAFPNRRRGVLSLTKEEIANDALALTFAKPNDQLKFAIDTLAQPTSRQQILLGRVGLFDSPESASRRINYDGKIAHKITFESVYGLTSWLEAPYRGYTIRSRPVIAVDASKNGTEGSIILFHELAHALQIMRHVAVAKTDPWSYVHNLEVEAYSLEADYITGLIDEGCISGQEAICRTPLLIKDIAKEHGSAAYPHCLNRPMRDAFESKGILDSIVRPKR